IEAQTGLAGFQNTANQFFKGDLHALVAHYQASDDPVFRSDATSLSTLLNRQRLLDDQFQAMQGPWYIRALQVAYAADPDIRQETLNAYTYQVLLSPTAIGWALAGALLFSFIIEGFFRLVDWVVLGGKRQRERIARRERNS
ncbi:MAG: DUF2937 family protein, partial [Pseudomonas sp.]|nr:DUF2937 family protein [Pseudomonas sp.]